MHSALLPVQAGTVGVVAFTEHSLIYRFDANAFADLVNCLRAINEAQVIVNLDDVDRIDEAKAILEYGLKEVTRKDFEQFAVGEALTLGVQTSSFCFTVTRTVLTKD